MTYFINEKLVGDRPLNDLEWAAVAFVVGAAVLSLAMVFLP